MLNVARGPLIVDEDLQAALDSGKVAGAALDVFRSEPITEHPLFGYPNVIVTPHLGASTAEATDRAGYQAAEQVVAALTGGVVTSAVNVPAIGPRTRGRSARSCRSAARSGRSRSRCTPGPRSTAFRPSSSAGSPSATRDCSAIHVLLGVLRGHTEEEVNEVNAPSLAEERGIEVVEIKQSSARDYTDLIRVTVTSGEHAVSVAGTVIGSHNRPHLLEAWGQRFDIPIEDHLTMFRYRDVPGMIGRVGTVFGTHGVNIVSAAVGRNPKERNGGDRMLAAMAITTDTAVPGKVVEEIASSDGFVAGRTVNL